MGSTCCETKSLDYYTLKTKFTSKDNTVTAIHPIMTLVRA